MKHLCSIAILIFLQSITWAQPEAPAQPRTLALEGTVVTPEKVIERGWVVVQGEKIAAVSQEPPAILGALKVKTRGIIFPGLIDLHNHVAWNALPRWTPPRQYSNRYEWRGADEYRKAVGDPASRLQKEFFCEMNQYGEVRALVGGVTSIQGSRPEPCIAGLVRNVDFYSSFYPGKVGSERLRHALDIDPVSDQAAQAIAKQIENNQLDSFLIHLSEGKSSDARSKAEFDKLVAKGLLTKKTAIIHGTAFGEPEFQKLREAGAALVWSPRSNVGLYGETTNIKGALAHGIAVALAPDWGVSGSSNMLDELRFAAAWNQSHLGGLLTDKQLVAMATEIPAKIAGIADKVGSIRPGLYADLLVIKGDKSQPYKALVQARAENVMLLLIGGDPIYGSAGLLKKLRAKNDFEPVRVCGAKMGISAASQDPLAPQGQQRFGEIEARLKTAFAALHPPVPLAPVAECH